MAGDWDLSTPNGCFWCGVQQREHYQRWVPGIGWHGFTEPTNEQRLERMRARAAVTTGGEVMATGRVRAEMAASEDLIAVLQRSLNKPDGDLYQLLLRSFEEPLNRDSATSAADTAAGLFMRAIRQWREQAAIADQDDDALEEEGRG